MDDVDVMFYMEDYDGLWWIMTYKNTHTHGGFMDNFIEIDECWG